MRAAPALRGGLVARLAWLVAGLFLFSCGIVFFLDLAPRAAAVGRPAPGDREAHAALVRRRERGRRVCSCSSLAWSLGARIGVGTVANAVLIGLFVVLLQPLVTPSRCSAVGLLRPRIGLLARRAACSSASARPSTSARRLGAGPRDSLMLVGSLRTGVRIGWVRALIESPCSSRVPHRRSRRASVPLSSRR